MGMLGDLDKNGWLASRMGRTSNLHKGLTTVRCLNTLKLMIALSFCAVAPAAQAQTPQVPSKMLPSVQAATVDCYDAYCTLENIYIWRNDNAITTLYYGNAHRNMKHDGADVVVYYHHQCPAATTSSPQAPSKALPAAQAGSQIRPAPQVSSKGTPFLSCDYKHSGRVGCNRMCINSAGLPHYCPDHGYAPASEWSN
jgi:hypothetical protein